MGAGPDSMSVRRGRAILRDGKKGGAWLTEGAGPNKEGSRVLVRVRGGAWGAKRDEG